MLKKTVIYAVIMSLVLAQGALMAQSKPSMDEGGTRDKRIPDLMKRLTAGIKNLKIEPDKDNKYTFIIKSGYQYDMLERQHLMVYRKAQIYMAGDRIGKIIFEYYQFSMDSKVWDKKIFTNNSPESEDLRTLEVFYDSNAAKMQKYTLADVQKQSAQLSVISQYMNYITSLVYNIELYKHKTIRVQTDNIERTIQLGE